MFTFHTMKIYEKKSMFLKFENFLQLDQSTQLFNNVILVDQYYFNRFICTFVKNALPHTGIILRWYTTSIVLNYLF